MHQPAFAAQRFLVVEDEPLIAIALQHLLEQEGATVIQAHNVTRALRLVDKSLSAGVIDMLLGDDNAHPICDELERRSVPFVFFTGQADAASHRWRSIPIVEKPALPEVIVGAIKYAISADKRDILSSNSDEADAKVKNAEQRIADGEERVARIRGLIARLQSRGFDTSVADKLLVTMTKSLDLMRDAAETWRATAAFRAKY